MQIFTLNITRVVWPHVTNLLDLRYFCRHNPLFYHLNLIPCHYWSWQRNIYFLVNIFVRHTFPMSKSSIKTKTVLTMTDMTQSTELQAFKRPKDGYKVTVKMSLCICVVLSWNELKVRQNLLASDCEIHMACLLVAVYWHKLLQFVKKSLTLHSELVYLWFISCFDDRIMLYYIPARFEFQFIYLLHLIISVAWQAWHLQIQRWINLRNTKRWFFFSSLHGF